MQVSARVARALSLARRAHPFIDFARLPPAADPLPSPAALGVAVLPAFLSEAEHDALLADADGRLRRRGFESGHWDGVIRGFREDQLPLSSASAAMRAAAARAHAHFPRGSGPPLPAVHILELEAAGHIAAHVDSVKFSGDVVAGLCLGSDCVMRLSPVEDGGEGGSEGGGGGAGGYGGYGGGGSEKVAPDDNAAIDLYLPRRCLYVLSGEARYLWAHAIPAGAPLFRGEPVTRARRVSLILRDEVAPTPAPIAFGGSLASRVMRAMPRGPGARRFSTLLLSSKSPAPASAAPRTEPRTHVLDLTFERLQAQLLSLGLPRFRAEQVFRSVLQQDVQGFEALALLPLQARQTLAASFAPLRTARILSESESKDGTVKFLVGVGGPGEAEGFSADDVAGLLPRKRVDIGNSTTTARTEARAVETVFIPEPRRGSGTLCVSSQAGCSLACSFCHTGTQAFGGSLPAHAIIEQVLLARTRLAERGALRLSHVVLMGQGEPLLNWRSVRTAIAAFAHPLGLAMPQRRITVSTAGVAPLIAAVATDTPGVRLAISLHAPTDALRTRIMGINSQWGVSEVLRGCQAFIDARLSALAVARSGRQSSANEGDDEDEGEEGGGDAGAGLGERPFCVDDVRNGARRVRVTFEYVLLDGVNDNVDCARMLADLLHDGLRDASRHAHVNLIRFHDWPGAPFQRSSVETALAFQAALEQRGLRATIRRSRGVDVGGACGQLRSSSLTKPRATVRQSGGVAGGACGQLRGFSSSSTSAPVLRVFDSLSQSVSPLRSAPAGGRFGAGAPPPLTIYACGPTVYDEAHVGHARTYVTLDLLRRCAAALTGRRVLLALNITDVDSKILLRARELGEHPTALARRLEAAFFDDLAALNVLPPAAAPRVTEHIGCIIDYVRAIVAHGLAYAARDGSGVYMDTAALAARGFGYGRLAPRVVAAEAAAEAAAVAAQVPEGAGAAGKRNSRDFALWKALRSGDPVQLLVWDSPWGRGRPGWHIECSAMAHAVFGDRIDVHAGGADLAFPHHCNELAQAQAFYASGLGTAAGSTVGTCDATPPHAWVGHWVHTGHVHIAGRKMSKSLKNFVTVRSMLANAGEGADSLAVAAGCSGADAFRMFCLQHHYASHLTFSPETSLRDSAAVVRRLSSALRAAAFLVAAARRSGSDGSDGGTRWGPAEHEFADRVHRESAAAAACCAEDFDLPGALRRLSELAAALQHYCARPSLLRPGGARLAAWAADALCTPLRDLGFEFAATHEAALFELAADRGMPLPAQQQQQQRALVAAAAPSPPPAVEALVALRAAVRAEASALGKQRPDAAAEAAAARLLALCDAVRDEALPALGWRLVDAAAGPELRAVAAAAAERPSRAGPGAAGSLPAPQA